MIAQHKSWFYGFTVAILFIVLGRSQMMSLLYHNTGSVYLAKELLPNPLPAYNLTCQTHFNLQEVEGFYKQAQQYNPDYFLTNRNLALINWYQGECQKASEQLHFLISKNEGSELLNLQLSIIKSTFQPSIFSSSELARYFYGQGHKLVSQYGYVLEAQAWYERSLTLQPDLKSAEQLFVFYEKNKPDYLSVWLESIMADSRTPHSLYLWARGQNFLLNGEFLPASDSFFQLAEAGEKPYIYYIKAGKLAHQANNIPLAISYLTKALPHQSSNNIDVQLLLGQYEAEQKQKSAAIAWYNQAQQIQPENGVSYFYMGKLFFDFKEYKEAEYWFDLAFNQGIDENPSIYYYKGQLAYQKGELNQAIEFLETAISFSSEKPISWYKTIIEWYIESKQCSPAVALHQTIINSNNSSAYAEIQELINTHCNISNG